MTGLPVTCMACFDGDGDPAAHRAGCPFLERGADLPVIMDAASIAHGWAEDVPRTDHGWGCVITCLYDPGRPAEGAE